MYNYLFGIIPPHFNDWLSYMIKPCSNKFNIELKNKRKIFVLACADYANMGDIAISLAQINFLRDNFTGYLIIPQLISDIYKDMKSLKKILNADDIITIIGGGNCGCMYPGIEFSRLFIINNFPDNLIVSFPQTISVFGGKCNEKTLKEMKKTYNSHKNLILCARERDSYSIYNELFVNKVALIPDIVFYFENYIRLLPQRGKNVILVCKRNDNEKFIRDEFWEKIEIVCNEKYVLEYQDTVLNKIYIDFQTQKLDLKKIFIKFMSANVVITDRLHGMIFSYITMTPCIVLPSLTNKISENYKWISKCNYISYISQIDINMVFTELERLINIKKLITVDIASYFNELKTIIEVAYDNRK